MFGFRRTFGQGRIEFTLRVIFFLGLNSYVYRLPSPCCATQAVKRDPTNAAYRNNLAAALTKIGDFNAAKAACEKVRIMDSNSLPSVGAVAVVDVFYVKCLPFGDERR